MGCKSGKGKREETEEKQQKLTGRGKGSKTG